MQDPWEDLGATSVEERRAAVALVQEALRADARAIKVEVDGRTFIPNGPDVYVLGLRLPDDRWAIAIHREVHGVHNPSGPAPRESVAFVLDEDDLQAQLPSSRELLVELRTVPLGVSP